MRFSEHAKTTTYPCRSAIFFLSKPVTWGVLHAVRGSQCVYMFVYLLTWRAVEGFSCKHRCVISAKCVRLISLLCGMCVFSSCVCPRCLFLPHARPIWARRARRKWTVRRAWMNQKRINDSKQLDESRFPLNVVAQTAAYNHLSLCLILLCHTSDFKVNLSRFSRAELNRLQCKSLSGCLGGTWLRLPSLWSGGVCANVTWQGERKDVLGERKDVLNQAVNYNYHTRSEQIQGRPAPTRLLYLWHPKCTVILAITITSPME